MYYTRRCTGTGACVLPSHAACSSTHLLWQLPHSRMFRGAAQDDCATTGVFCNLFICQFRGANAYFFQGEIIPHPRVDVDKHLFKFEPRHTSAVITGRFDGGRFGAWRQRSWTWIQFVKLGILCLRIWSRLWNLCPCIAQRRCSHLCAPASCKLDPSIRSPLAVAAVPSWLCTNRLI